MVNITSDTPMMNYKFLHRSISYLIPQWRIINIFLGIDKLNTTIYDTACSMKLPGKNKQCLIGRKYPRSYFKVERLIQEEQQYRNERKKTPFLSKIEFNELLEKLPTRDNDINSEEEEEAGIREHLYL